MNEIQIRTLKVWLLILLEYFKRFIKWFWFGLFLFLAALFLQLKFSLFHPADILRIGLIGTFQEHDIPIEVTSLASKSLVAIDASGRPKADLVSGWETNNDATQFKFKLKDNLKWIDGSFVKSRDLEFSIPNTQITYPDDKTIQFSLKEPYSPLPTLLTKPVFKKGTFLGIGPYQITELDKSRIFITKLVLKQARSDMPLIYVRFYPNEKVATAGFNLGEVQAILGLSNTKPFLGNPKVTISQKIDFTKIVTILFQTKDALLSNRSLRQALSYEAPNIKGEMEANNPYPSKSWAYNPEAKRYLSNKEEAKSALDRAKSAMSEDKLQAEIILTATTNLEDVGKAIIEAWKALGFDAKLRIESGIPQNFQALLITQSIPQDPDQYFLWHATQTKTNLSKYDSKRADKDLEDGRKIINEEDRRIKYFDFQKALLEDAPAVFLYFPKYNIVYLKKVEGLLNKILNL